MAESASLLVNAARQNDAVTANGAVTHSTSLNSVLDLFFIAGASRKMSEDQIKRMFIAAWTEDRELTLKLLFWARDIRGGAGERRFFNICMEYLATNHPQLMVELYSLIPEYGYWKDFLNIPALRAVGLHEFRAALDRKDGLAAKYAPRKGDFANDLRKLMGLTPKEYRKTIVELSNTVEQKMCAKDWEGITYEHVPSVAMNRYRKAFYKNDLTRFEAFIGSVEKGETKINAAALFPVDLVQKLGLHGSGYGVGITASAQERKAIDVQWNALPNYLKDNTERIIAACDVSGSMGGTPLLVSVSLGLYLSMNTEGVFKDAFMTFSGKSKMYYLKGTMSERFSQIKEDNMNTNLQSVFEVLLATAKRVNAPENEMPTKVMVISDMEFDYVSGGTNLNAIKQQYETAGYKMPGLIFWNVKGRQGNSPANQRDKNVALVSGYSPAIVKSVLGGEDFTPVGVMLKTLNSDRYAAVKLLQ